MSSTDDDTNPLKLRLYQVDRTIVFTLNPGEINEQKVQYEYTCDIAANDPLNLIYVNLFTLQSSLPYTFITKSERFQEIDSKKYGDKKLRSHRIYNFLILSVELIK